MQQMKNAKAHSGGGAAAAASPLTFSGCRAVCAESAHLQKPTQMMLKFPKKSPKDDPPYNLEDIRRLNPLVEITIEVTQTEKCFKVLVGFKSAEDLEKFKSLLKTCEFLSTTKGKTSKWKPEVSVVQPKKSEKSEQKEESAVDLEPFPLGILGDHHLASVQPMHQSVHKFLHPSIYLSFMGSWRIDERRWGDLVKLQFYESSKTLGNSSTCVPHPNNPESQRDIVQMQQGGMHYETLKNWKHAGFFWVPRKVLEIPEYWIPNCVGSNEEIQQSDPATLISPLVSCHVSPYPVFDPDAFTASLGDISVHPQDSTNHVSFWLTDAVASALFQTDDRGNITTSLKVRYAQMVETDAYLRNQRVDGDTLDGEIFPGFETRVTPPNHLLVMHPSSCIEIFVLGMKGKTCGGLGGIRRYDQIGKVLIPFQFLSMPQVWVNLKRSSYRSWH